VPVTNWTLLEESEPRDCPNGKTESLWPYITAVVKEGFRWRLNIADIRAPTTLIKDDEYEGYKFLSGTVFVWNAWATALNPKE
jgi:cytochrome P450